MRRRIASASLTSAAPASRAAARGRAEDLRERPEGDPVSVGGVAPGEDRGRWLRRPHRLDQLGGEASLAGPGLADDQRQPRRSLPDGLQVGEAERFELAAAPEQRHRARSGAVAPADRLASPRIYRPPGLERGREALRIDRPPAVEDRRPTGGGGACADQDLAGRRRLLQARRCVGGLARDRPIRLVNARQHLAGLDPDPDLELAARREAPDQSQRRGDRPIGIVAVGAGNPEHRHHGVADELLDPAAVLLERRAGDLEERVEQPPDILRIAPLDQLGRSDQIREDDRRELALDPGRRPDRGAARRAVPGAFGDLGAHTPRN